VLRGERKLPEKEKGAAEARTFGPKGIYRTSTIFAARKLSWLGKEVKGIIRCEEKVRREVIQSVAGEKRVRRL